MTDVRGSYNRILVSTIREDEDVYLDIKPKELHNALATGAMVDLSWFDQYEGNYVEYGRNPLISYAHTEEDGYVATFVDLSTGSVTILTYVAPTENDRFKFNTEP